MEPLFSVRLDCDSALIHLVFILKKQEQDGPKETYDLKRVEMVDSADDSPASDFKKALLARLDDLKGLTPVNFNAFSTRLPHEVEVVKVKEVPVLCEILAAIDRMKGPEWLDPVLKIDEELLEHLAAYAVIAERPGGVQNSVLYFRKLQKSKVFRMGGPLKMLFKDGRLQKSSHYVFNFDEHADALVYGGEVFVFQRTLFEELFDYGKTVYQSIAKEAISHLQSAGVLSLPDLGAFEEACVKDPNKLRKLADIGHNIDPKKLTWEAIESVQQRWGVPVSLDFTRRQIVFTATTTWSILKLLDDDFLRSDMTGSFYEVQSKRRLRGPGRLRARRSTAEISIASGRQGVMPGLELAGTAG